MEFASVDFMGPIASHSLSDGLNALEKCGSCISSGAPQSQPSLGDLASASIPNMMPSGGMSRA